MDHLGNTSTCPSETRRSRKPPYLHQEGLTYPPPASEWVSENGKNPWKSWPLEFLETLREMISQVDLRIYIYIFFFTRGGSTTTRLLGGFKYSLFSPWKHKKKHHVFFYPNKKEGLFCMPSMYLINFCSPFFWGVQDVLFGCIFSVVALPYPNKFVAVFNL